MELPREPEDHFRDLFESAPLPYQSLDAGGRVLDVNQAWLDALGYERDEVMGRWFGDFLPPGQQGRFGECFAHLQTRGRISGLEFELLRKDGSLLPVMYDGRIARHADGSFMATHCIWRDLSAERAAREDLRRSVQEVSWRNRIAEVFLTVPDEGMYAEVLDIVLEAMESKYGIFGYVDEAGDLVCPSMTRDIWDQCQMPDKNIVFPRATWGGQWGRALLEGATQVSNVELTVPAGHIPIHRAISVPISHQGEAIGLLTVGNKATDYSPRDQGILERIAEAVAPVLKARLERDRAEGAVRESERRFREMLETVELVAVTLDLEGRITFCNDYLLRLTGWKREEVLGRTWFDLFLPAGCRDVVRQMFHAAVAAGEAPAHYVNPIITRSGRERSILWDNTLLRGPDGRLEGSASIGRDVTEQEALAEQLRQAQKMEALGRLAGGVAHDFNNLLTVVNGYAALLLARLGAGDTLRPGLEEILKAGDRAADLTRQLLAFSRRQVLEPRVVDLNRVVTGLESMLRRLIGEEIQVLVRPKASAGTIRVDPGQLHQVILNLALNARDAMPEGGELVLETGNVEVDATRALGRLDLQPGCYVVLAVSDTGRGMDEETRRRLFEPFFTTKEPGQGTGLGLATVYGIVRQSGGQIWVYSEPGQGTTFKIYFPCVDAAVAAEAPAAGAVQARGTGTVLLVEDQADVRGLAAAVLREAGYRVIEAASGAEAIASLERDEGPIDLLLTDVVMPGMGGLALAERLRGMRPGMKVLYVSGHPSSLLALRDALEAGSKYLQKPFTPEELAATVREAMSLSPP